jgi:hypothetical protein
MEQSTENSAFAGFFAMSQIGTEGASRYVTTETNGTNMVVF